MSNTTRTDAFKKNPYVLGHQLWEDFAHSLEGDLTEALAALRWVNAGVARDDPRMWSEVSRVLKKHPQPSIHPTDCEGCPSCGHDQPIR